MNDHLGKKIKLSANMCWLLSLMIHWRFFLSFFIPNKNRTKGKFYWENHSITPEASARPKSSSNASSVVVDVVVEGIEGTIKGIMVVEVIEAGATAAATADSRTAMGREASEMARRGAGVGMAEEEEASLSAAAAVAAAASNASLYFFSASRYSFIC
jgi:hypothetical protein